VETIIFAPGLVPQWLVSRAGVMQRRSPTGRCAALLENVATPEMIEITHQIAPFSVSARLPADMRLLGDEIAPGLPNRKCGWEASMKVFATSRCKRLFDETSSQEIQQHHLSRHPSKADEFEYPCDFASGQVAF
jgi:alpha-D-ribose 1-methylphosphonate 5-phosphate C-P lyase